MIVPKAAREPSPIIRKNAKSEAALGVALTIEDHGKFKEFYEETTKIPRLIFFIKIDRAHPIGSASERPLIP